MTFCIRCTLPLDSCICQHWPNIDLCGHSILFHPLEIHKRSSTGRLLKKFSNMETRLWHRKANQDLSERFANYKLVFPSANDKGQDEAHHPQPTDKLLYIDSTWQQARKMLRQSPWLKSLPRVEFRSTAASRFKLRRNQTEIGLSTLEAIANCLFEQGRSQQSQDLLEFLALFQSAYLNARDSGMFKS